jgi:FKBP-type peptidyl-prolyl cis-trans isomerase FklB
MRRLDQTLLRCALACTLPLLMMGAAWAQGAPAAGAKPTPAPASAPAAPTPEPVADDASSYAIGLNFGLQLRSGGVDHAVNLDPLMRGVKDALAGKLPSAAEKDQAMQLVRTGRAALTERNHRAAQEFLAKNATVKGVLTTASGLQYQVFSPGESGTLAPTEKDRVTINFRGHLLDGTEFDNSDAHDQAAVFTVGSVIKGWKEALLMMKPGAKWRLYVPPALAYDAYSPPTIPPGSLLIFDLELLKVEAPPNLSDSQHKRAPSGAPSKTPRVPAVTAPEAGAQRP